MAWMLYLVLYYLSYTNIGLLLQVTNQSWCEKCILVWIKGPCKCLADSHWCYFVYLLETAPFFLIEHTSCLKSNHRSSWCFEMCIVLTQNRLQEAENYYRDPVNKIRLLDGSHSTWGKGVTHCMESQRFQLWGLQKGAALQRYLFLLILAFFFFCEKEEGWVAGYVECCSYCRTTYNSNFCDTRTCHRHSAMVRKDTILEKKRNKWVKKDLFNYTTNIKQF